MSAWQRRARLLIAVFAVAFGVVVLFAFKHGAPPPPPPQPTSTATPDPNVVVQSTGGNLLRFSKTREEVSVRYEKQLTYADGSTALVGVTIASEGRAGGRSFTVTSREGRVGQNESTIKLDGEVKLTASDGMSATTEHATYADADGIVRAPGRVEFGRGRMQGSGIGMTYDKNQDSLTILDQAVVHIAPDEKGAGSADIKSGTALYPRRDKYLRFERDVSLRRGSQVTTSDTATAYLTGDEKRIDKLELRGNARIAESSPVAGALQMLNGRDMDLQYAEGNVLERAVITGEARLQLAGEDGKPGRQISANTLDIGMAPDGNTPTAVIGRDRVELTFPPEPGRAAGTVRANQLDAKGEAGRGLTSARLTGSVEYREKGETERVARSAILDLALRPGTSAIDEARFSRNVRFEQGAMTASAANGRYLLDQGKLELTGSEPQTPTPHVVNEQIAVDATRIDLTLEGPMVKAAGSIKSVLQPAKKDKDGKTTGDTKTPSLLKQDQPTNVTGDNLDYDGTKSKATYTGNAQLWQADTTIRGQTIVIDDKTGDLTAAGGVTTSVMLEQVNSQTKAQEKVRSIGSSKDFHYEDATRKASYVTEAHLSGPQGDMTAKAIDLYLKPSGDELDRAEAFEDVTLREPARKTTGSHMTYFAADERYLVEGAPVKIVDDCGQESVGRIVTFFKSNDLIILDGRNQMRARTKGAGTACPGS